MTLQLWDKVKPKTENRKLYYTKLHKDFSKGHKEKNLRLGFVFNKVAQAAIFII